MLNVSSSTVYRIQKETTSDRFMLNVGWIAIHTSRKPRDGITFVVLNAALTGQPDRAISKDRQGYLERNPLQHLEIPAGERKEIVVNNGEYDRIFALTSPQSFRDLIITTWETGCRLQESLRVEARHVDLHNQRWV